MSTKIKIALIAALVASTASAALARTTPHNVQSPSNFGQVMTDEGQGRYYPADGGAP